MAKLYPPMIEGTIPAFCGTVLTVPFALNKAVAKTEIAGFVLKIKTVQGSTLLGTIRQVNSDFYDLDSKMEVMFDLSNISGLNIGQHYKIQIAFINYTGTVGYFSTVGVTKYISTPTLYISNLNANAINNHNYYYTGFYSQEGQDTTEKMHSCRFKLFDSDGNILHDSGEIIHNVSNDENSYEAYETYTIAQDFEVNTSYYLQFFATTSNGYEAKSAKYRLVQRKSLKPDLAASLDAQLNYEDGFIDIYLKGHKDENGREIATTGSFVVCRCANNEDNVWNRVCEFSLQSQTPSRFLWRDYTIEQGVVYQYSIQQYNDYDLLSDRILSPLVKADFEDAFLFDGERQLKIRYNSKVSSFKTDILENKVDTIGSKYPFIFRNGNVYYKEFPIGGLVSYQMDDNRLFMSWSELGGLTEREFDPVSDNILAERLFKIKVLEWLNDGKPKLFKSPSEGNYIVRLLNNSLSPIDSLGRMLHNFSSTAYEVAEYSYENLFMNGFITIPEEITSQIRWTTVSLAGHNEYLDKVLKSVRTYVSAGVNTTFTEEQYNRILSYDSTLAKYFSHEEGQKFYSLYSNLNSTVVNRLEAIIGQITYVTGRINSRPALSIFAVDMLPGTMIELWTEKPGQPIDKTIIQIGATGSYRANFSEPVTSIVMPANKDSAGNIIPYGIQGSITYSYESAAMNIFDTIQEMNIQDVPIRQWIGHQEKTYFDKKTGEDAVTDNLVEIIEDSKTNIVNFFALRFQKREIQRIYINRLSSADGNEVDGIPVAKLPKGIKLEPVTFTQEDPYKPNLYYYKFDLIPEGVQPGESYVATQCYALATSPVQSDYDLLYKKVYTYYTDIYCNDPLDLDNLDAYKLYAICNARFNYKYADVWFEQYYTEANLNNGYYVDVNGEKVPAFTGQYLDGCSTSKNLILFNQEDYSTHIQIDDADIDINETEKYELHHIEDRIKTIKFGTGVICEASYQIRIMTYNIETTDKIINSFKEDYESAINKLNALRKLVSIDVDFEITSAKYPNKNSTEFKKLQEQYNNDRAKYIRIIGNNIFNNGNYNYKELEQQYMEKIKTAYSDFIYHLDVALKSYEEAQLKQ